MALQTTDRNTQRGRILGLLIANRGSAVPLPEILKLGVAQYNARIFELRRLGFSIQNFQEGGHSFFRLQSGPSIPTLAPIAPAPTLFDMSGGHRDE